MLQSTVKGGIVQTDSGAYYQIENAHDMPAFFINIATSSDIWMFLSSCGALTAGRQNAEAAIFPYETDDRLHLASSTGPKTLIRMADGRIWEPFDQGRDNPFVIRRNLYKRLTGDAVLFEEINETLGLTFTYRWETGETFGLVRTAEIKNNSGEALSLFVLDGVQNIIPYGVSQGLADSSSCLTDAYKVCERYGSLAVYSLTSAIVDTPEPVEILHANVAWRIGGEADAYLLSSKQVAAFCKGKTLENETRSFGVKSAYLTSQTLNLASGAAESWLLVMDARLSQPAVIALMEKITKTQPDALRAAVEADIKRGTAELLRIVGAADGLQCTEDTHATARHYMNVLYNNMRGGVFLDGYEYDPALFAHFVQTRDKAVAERQAGFLHAMAANHSIVTLKDKAYETGDADLIRLCLEFLPLTFSRRHGDPSRPWNRFHIRVKDDAGNRIYHYEGNWRDIFQNWEAMSLSFPEYIDAMIAKFLNASTADGFNPYRISEDGVDWEVPQPHDPFSGYGYWGDHQIVYLNKLLEWLDAYKPDYLKRLMASESFTFAEVPYEIKPYAELVKDGKNTIAFNYKRHEQIMQRAAERGSDGKLLTDGKGGIYHASFVEKLLIPVLAKLSNLVAGGGIWMNTQRPEWNDANNAIVGNGLSMVTVYQLYRYLLFCQKVLRAEGGKAYSVSALAVEWSKAVHSALAGRKGRTPRGLLDELGKAFDRYRAQVYVNGLGGKTQLAQEDILKLFDEALAALAESIDANKREDGLYHSYNIMRLTRDGLEISPMFVMLEGQTAVLGSGRLTPDEALKLVAAMESGGLYSPEHKTFYLYPVKQLKTFLERNTLPDDAAARSTLIALLLDTPNTLVTKDGEGHIRFSDTIRQSADLERALETLSRDARYTKQVEAEGETIREMYEQVFAHRQFTGRSGIMYKYEGIGSIYWHQNSKFLLSFQECAGSAPAALKETYYRLREGLGFTKEPSLWGAFPLEPYSHTPYRMPAQQPGMTGQVKEDILTRNAELGLCVKEGVVGFSSALLNKSEFLSKPGLFSYVGTDGETHELPLDAGTLAFTVCQTPVVYRIAEKNKVTVYGKDAVLYEEDGLSLDTAVSRSLFAREGAVAKIVVDMN